MSLYGARGGAQAGGAPSVAVFGGAGGVGASVVFNLLRSETPYDVMVVDTRPNMVTSHVMDLTEVLSLGGGTAVRAAAPEEAAGADVVVVSAAVPLRLNTSRSVFLLENARVLDSIVGPLRSAGWDGLLVVMTNPVDPLLTWLHRRHGLDPRRVVGYTTNDSLRLRTGVARALGERVQDVEAWVLGEHGEHQVPLYSRVRVRGELVTLSPAERAVAQEYVDTWYERHVALDSGRTSTWSSGLGAALLVDALTAPVAQTWPVSAVLDGPYGVTGTAVGVPARLSRAGVSEVLDWALPDDEAQGVRRAADHVSAAASALEQAFGGALGEAPPA